MHVTPHNPSPLDTAHASEPPPQEGSNRERPPPPTSLNTSSNELVRRGNSIELSLRDAVSIHNTSTATRVALRADLLAVTQRQFASFKNGENDAAVEVLAQQRADRLLERGENPHELESLFTFADLAIDLPANALKGFANGAPFAMANLIAKFLPAMAPAKQGALSGAITILLVHFGSNINSKATDTPSWGKTRESLEPTLAEGDRRDQMTAIDVFKKIGTTFQLFPVSFAASGAINSGLAQANLDAGIKAQFAIGPATAMVGSAVVDSAGHFVEHRYDRSNPGHILAQENWENTLDELKRTTVINAAGNGMRHIFNKDTLARMKDGLFQAFKTLPNLSTLAQAVVWTGGLSLYSHVTSEINKDSSRTNEEKFIVQQMMFAAALFPITFFWTAAIALGPIMDKKAGTALAKAWESLPAWKHEAERLPPPSLGDTRTTA